MKRLGIVASIMLLLTAATGCMSITGLEKELAKDPASVHLEVRSIYGIVILDRNVSTNSTGALR